MSKASFYSFAGLIYLGDVGLVALETSGRDVAVVGSTGGLRGADAVVAFGDPAVETFFGKGIGRGCDMRGLGTRFRNGMYKRRGKVGRWLGRHRKVDLQNRPWK
jgi:hypothetical protein